MNSAWGDVFTTLGQRLPGAVSDVTAAIDSENQKKALAQRQAAMDALTQLAAEKKNQKDDLDIAEKRQEAQQTHGGLDTLATLVQDKTNAATVSPMLDGTAQPYSVPTLDAGKTPFVQSLLDAQKAGVPVASPDTLPPVGQGLPADNAHAPTDALPPPAAQQTVTPPGTDNGFRPYNPGYLGELAKIKADPDQYTIDNLMKYKGSGDGVDAAIEDAQGNQQSEADAAAKQKDYAFRDKELNQKIAASQQAHEDADKARRDAKSISLGVKNDQHQDALEQQARANIISIRGDRALANTEIQRDAAISAYNRIDQIKKSGTQLNPIDYVDVLGQIYKARTGSSPTQIVLDEAMQKTTNGQLGKVYTYFTGKQAPATTPDIMNSLQEMSMHMGQQADRLHDGYMKSHLDMPTSLEAERANRIRNLARGISFSEATETPAYNAQPAPQVQQGTTKQYSADAVSQAKAALSDPNAPDSIKKKAHIVLGY